MENRKVSNQTREELLYKLSKEGFRMALPITGYTGAEPAVPSFIGTTFWDSLLGPGNIFYCRKMRLVANRNIRIELQYQKDPPMGGVTGTYPLAVEMVVLRANVATEVDIDSHLWGRCEIRYMKNLDIPEWGYYPYTATGTINTATNPLVGVANGSSNVTLTLDTSTAVVGKTVIVRRLTGSTGTITIASTSGTIAVTSMPTNGYVELIWNGVNWETPTLDVRGSAPGYRHSYGIDMYAPKVVYMGDSIGAGSGVTATSNPYWLSMAHGIVRNYFKQTLKVRCEPANLSFSGANSNSADFLMQIDRYNVENPGAFIYAMSMNDLSAGFDSTKQTTYSTNLSKMLAWVRYRYGAEIPFIVLGTTPVLNNGRHADAQVARGIASTFVTTKNTAGDNRVYYVNAGDDSIFDRTVFANYTSTDSSTDPVHPSQTSHGLIAAYVAAQLTVQQVPFVPVF